MSWKTVCMTFMLCGALGLCSFGLIAASCDAAVQTAPNLNPLNTLFIHFYFPEQGESSVPFSISKTEWLVESGEDSIVSFFNEISYGQVQLVPNYMGLFSLDKTKAQFQSEDPLGGTMVQSALEIVQSTGLLNQVGLVVMMLPPLDYGYPGCSAYKGLTNLYINGQQYTGRFAWLSGNDFGCYNRSLMSHEMAHTFGLGHSSVVDCSDRTLPNPIDISEPINCSSKQKGVDYATGDAYDVMGEYRGHPNAYWKLRAGWIDDSQIAVVNKTMQFQIDALEENTNGIKSLRVPIEANDGGEEISYWIEYRTHPIVDLDSGIVERTTNQIQIRLNMPTLVDQYGQTQEDITLYYNLASSQMMLNNVGDSFSDPYRNLTIKWESVSHDKGSSPSAKVTVRRRPKLNKLKDM